MVTIEVGPNRVIARLQLQQGSRIRSGKKHPEELKITHSGLQNLNLRLAILTALPKPTLVHLAADPFDPAEAPILDQ